MPAGTTAVAVDTAASGSDATVLNREDATIADNPLEVLNGLQFGPAAGFNNLIKASIHFYIFCKNSHGLHLNYNWSTKIGESK